MISFLILMSIYIALCIVGFKGYFYLQCKVKSLKSNNLSKAIYSYTLFIVFICVEIPFAIFFPAWINSKLMMLDENTATTASMLLFGCFVLAISIWKGKSYRPNDF